MKAARYSPPLHEYEADPASGAGNCTCGATEAHARHPHTFTPARVDPPRCVCGCPPNDARHRQGEKA